MVDYYKIIVNNKTNKITKIKPVKCNGMDMTEHCELEFYGFSKLFYIIPLRSKYYVSMSGISIFENIIDTTEYLKLKSLIENHLK